MGDPTRPVFYSRALCSATMPVTKLWRYLQSMDEHDRKACDLERMRLIDKYVGEERHGYGVDCKTLGSIMGYREERLHALMGCDLSRVLYPELYVRPGY